MNVNTTVLNTVLEHVIMWMAAVTVKKDILGKLGMKVNVIYIIICYYILNTCCFIIGYSCPSVFLCVCLCT